MAEYLESLGQHLLDDVAHAERLACGIGDRHRRRLEGSAVEITTEPSAFEATRKAVEELGVKIENAELTMQPKQTVPVGEDKAAAVLRLLEALEEDEDVQQVYANFDIPADVLERVSASV